jgi:hypothetical protein
MSNAEVKKAAFAEILALAARRHRDQAVAGSPPDSPPEAGRKRKLR